MTDAAAEVSARAERRALTGSIVASGALGAVAVGWGLTARADVVVFDGIFTLAGIALVAVSLLASRAAASAPSRRFPFGRHAATPLTVAMQGAAIFATLVYGAVSAVGTIVAGGSEAGGGAILAYGAFSAVVAAAVAWWLQRVAPDGDLARAEVVSWRAGAALSVVVAVGGVVALALQAGGHDRAASFVDPVLVLVAVVSVAPLPVRLVREGMHELLEGAAPADVLAAVGRAVDGARAGFDLPDPLVRATKLGRRLYVEVDFVVAEHHWDVDDEDRVRRAVTDALEALPFDVWANVELTTDRELAE
jgi:predicted Co/Zn/Cd cation transporter (cation efflux family)